MDSTAEERKKAEFAFFANPKSNWGRMLKPSQLGIDALSKRLSTQLIRHIAAEVCSGQEEIDAELKRCTEKLGEYGDGLDTLEQMRGGLHGWCDRSQRLTHAALQGHGINPPGEKFFDGKTYSRNFRSRVVIQNQNFATHMENWGSSCLIIDDNGTRSTKHITRNESHGPPEVLRSEYIRKEVHPLFNDNPGLELPMDMNSLLVYQLFQSNSRQWEEHAVAHIDSIYKLCEEFLTQLLQYLLLKQVQMRIWPGFIQGKLDLMRANANEEMQKLNADRLKLIKPYESDFEKSYFKPTELEAGGGTPPDQANYKYEDVLREMLLMYKVHFQSLYLFRFASR